MDTELSFSDYYKWAEKKIKETERISKFYENLSDELMQDKIDQQARIDQLEKAYAGVLKLMVLTITRK